MRHLMLILTVAFVIVAAPRVVRTQQRATLDIYFIDVEGGQSTLFVSPSGESLLVDTGSPGARDAGRIAAVAKQAGLTRIDYLLITHYDGDHVGGAADVASRIPIRTFVDHGAATMAAERAQAIFKTYADVRAKGRHVEVKAGDAVPIAGIDVHVVSANGGVLRRPLPGAGGANPLCRDHVPHPVDTSENINSVGVIVRSGRFRLLDLGDLTWNTEHDLVCPNNLLGTVDVYLTTHHGLTRSGPPALVHAVHPRVAIVNNGPTKGASAETVRTLRTSPGLEDIWQLHYAVRRPPNAAFEEQSDPGGDEQNTSAQLIANVDQAADHSPAYLLKISARSDGGFTVLNTRNGFSKEYTPPNRR